MLRDGRFDAHGAAALAVGMVLLGLGAHAPAAWSAVGVIAGLALAAGGVCIIWLNSAGKRELLGLVPMRRGLAWAPVFLALAAGMAIYYRYRLGYGTSPDTLTLCALWAGLIGLGEELVYRGFLQGAVLWAGALLSSVLAAGAHTAYKCGLLAVSPQGAGADLAALATVTMAVGIVLGLARALSGSLLLPCLFHVTFDVLVYGDMQRLPWWAGTTG